VRARGGNRCQHCGTTEERLVVDHKVPHDRYPGSFFDMRNLWTLCARDNNSKRDLSADEWLAALARRRPASRAVTDDYTRRAGPSPYIFGGTPRGVQ
jgi:5-methylcytosine-specific restriction endonuclease McrA